MESSFDVCELSTRLSGVSNSRRWLRVASVFLQFQKRGDMRHLRFVAFADRPNVAAADASVVLHECALAAFMEMLWSVLAARGTGRSDANAAGWRFGHEDLLTALGEEPASRKVAQLYAPRLVPSIRFERNEVEAGRSSA